MNTSSTSSAERYGQALRRARHTRLPSDCPMPQPTSAWPEENVALLERYHDWLLSSGTSQDPVEHLYIPMAGHALGLNLKLPSQLDLDADLKRALDYVIAKQLSAEWTDMCRNALNKFRLFLHQQRDQAEVVLHPLNHERYRAGLPHWLVEQLARYQHLMQRHWRPVRLNQQTMRFWSGHTRLWRWLFERYPITTLADIKRQHVLDYIDHRLAAGYAPSGINQDLLFPRLPAPPARAGHAVPQALLLIRALKEPDRLPRFLTDKQVRNLRDEVERHLAQACTPDPQRDALLDRAAFYLLWQGGLR